MNTGYSLLVAAATFSLILPLPAAGPCPSQALLPAYAHNDYYNAKPLSEALGLGFQGVEVDYVMVDGELLVGHSRGEALPGRTLERLYLTPLRERVRRCGWVQSPDRPFLLTIDYKDQGPRGYQALRGLLQEYTDIIGTTAKPGPVKVVLVGWHPPLRELGRDTVKLMTVQIRISGSGFTIPEGDTALVGLLSLDYGKTMRWNGKGGLSRDDRRVLAEITEARKAFPGRLVRAYNLPEIPEVYQLLLRSGVDLIGVKDLDQTPIHPDY